MIDHRALIDELIRFEALDEFQSLKVPGRLGAYGPPFKPTPESAQQQSSPLILSIMRAFLFTERLPSMRNCPDTFWSDRVQPILNSMASCNLSDSYDKAKVSKRKILGLACVVFLSTVSRGLLLKLPPPAKQGDDKPKSKDEKDPNDVSQSWYDVKQKLIYDPSELSKLLELFEKSTDPSIWPNDLHLARVYVRATVASLLHYLFVGSSDAAETTRIVRKLHSRLPWFGLRQALKVGNVSNMVAAVTKIFLAKPLMFGKQNLLQTLISAVLGSDKSRMEKKLEQLDREDHDMSKDQRAAIDTYANKLGRKKQESIRNASMDKGISIVASILDHDGVKRPSDESTHAALMEYLSLVLGRRDRTLLIQTLCENDRLTDFVRDLVDMFYPLIHEVHSSVDLADGTWDLQIFLDDLMEMVGDPQKAKTVRPHGMSKLIERHEYAFYKLAHQLCKNNPSFRDDYARWYRHCLDHYCQRSDSPESANIPEPQSLLEDAIIQLDEQDQASLEQESKMLSDYRSRTHQISIKRLDSVLNGGDQEFGNGEWLCVWRDLHATTRVSSQNINAAPIQAQQSGEIFAAPEISMPQCPVTRDKLLPIWRSMLASKTANPNTPA